MNKNIINFPQEKRLEKKENELLNSIGSFFHDDIEYFLSSNDKKSLYKVFFINIKLNRFFDSIKHKKVSVILFKSYINELENIDYNFRCVES